MVPDGVQRDLIRKVKKKPALPDGVAVLADPAALIFGSPAVGKRLGTWIAKRGNEVRSHEVLRGDPLIVDHGFAGKPEFAVYVPDSKKATQPQVVIASEVTFALWWQQGIDQRWLVPELQADGAVVLRVRSSSKP